MQDIPHNQLSDFIQHLEQGAVPAVCLIHGQEMLVERSQTAVIEKLLGPGSKALSCETVDGLVENIPDLLEKMNTFSLLAGPKIVLFRDARLFEGRTGHPALLDQIAEAHAAGDTGRAAKSFLKLCSLLEMDIEASMVRPKKAGPLQTLFGLTGSEGVHRLGRYCLDNGWRPAAPRDHVSALQSAIDRGFPDQHHLIISVNSKVPRNLKLYKLIRDKGVVIDCSVPTGERRADKQAQEAILRQALDGKLAEAGKRLPPGLFQKLCRFTGFDLRTFMHNVEKLIDYIGERHEITGQDLDAVLQRTKIDPVFELTNAVADRNHILALSLLNGLLAANWHPLQILSALANQMRKLLVAKDFTRSRQGREWSAGISFPQFQSRTMPGIQAFDADNQNQASQWRGPDLAREKKGRGKPGAGDVALAPNPRNAYPVYQTLLKSEKYTLHELLAALQSLSQADQKLKSSAQDPAMVIRRAVSEICRPAGG